MPFLFSHKFSRMVGMLPNAFQGKFPFSKRKGFAIRPIKHSRFGTSMETSLTY